MRRPPARTVTTLLAVVGVLATSSACTTAGADQTGSNGYVSGDGTITLIAPADRKTAPTLQGDRLGGGTLDTADYAGKTLVLNVWGAWCGECRGEAKDLVEASRQLPDTAFVGIDTRDRESLALAYVRRFEVPYPSLVDQDSKLLLKFYGVVAANAIPSTLVIDRDGKLAAVITGPTTTSTLVGVVEDVAQKAG